MGFLSKVLGTDNSFNATKPVVDFQATSPVQPGTLATANTQAAGGAGPATGTIAQQNALSGQLQAAANGQGPSPAQTMLAKATSQNINTAAGQAASARGVNPALAARMAVDSAATANQGSAADAATLKANEQIAARQQLGQNLAQTGQMQLGQQQTGIQGLGTAGNLDLGAQGLNEKVAGQNAALDLGAQQINAGVAAQNSSTNAGIVGGIMNGAGAAMAAAHGGEIPEPQGSGPLFSYLSGLHKPQALEGGGTVIEPWMADGSGYTGAETPTNLPAAPSKTGKQAGSGLGAVGDSMAQAGKDGLSAFSRFTSMPVAGTMYATGGSIHADPSGMVPGRAMVPGDSPRNDVVKTLLSPGEIVIPRSITQGPNAPAKAASFVASILKRGGNGRKPGPTAAPAAKAGSAPTKAADDKPKTGRGQGRDETKRRIKRIAAPAETASEME